MTEVPRPESEKRQRPDPIRVFSGATVTTDGSFVRPYHQQIYDLWIDQLYKSELPGLFRVIPVGTTDEPKRTVYIQPFTHQGSYTLERLRDKFEQAVNTWVSEGEPKFSSLDDFRERYISDELPNQ